jgi:hypothetical protein
MGSLTPGITYIYERNGHEIYAREFGKLERKLIGYDVSNSAEGRLYRSQINQVLTMCEQDLEMKELLNKLFVLYNLKKKHE